MPRPTLFARLLAAALGLLAAACSPTATVHTTDAAPPQTSGTTGNDSVSLGGLCSGCQTDTDCGEEGSAVCVFESNLPTGHCAPACVNDSDCDPGAVCTGTDSATRVCYPKDQTCADWAPVGASGTTGEVITGGSTTGSATDLGGTTTSSSSGGTSASTSTSTSSSSTTGSSGGTATGSSGTTTGGSCPGYADPNTPAGCTCASGHTCSANNCYGGYDCDLSTSRCVAPPASCGGSSTTTSTSSGGTSGGTTGAPNGIGPGGGTVNLLHFGISGDTRPPSCEDTANYPTAIIDSIGDAEKAAGAQFALDLGDHMYVCNEDQSVSDAQMGLFMQGTQHFGGTWFMTMGNHECEHTPCLSGSTDANYVSFMNALAPISSRPYYSVDIQTSRGLATFVFIADNAFDTTQANWLDAVLATADQKAIYTIIAKHHPEGDTSVSTNAQEMQIIRAHRFALLLTGHAHKYQHQTTDNGRDLVLGNGGAPLVSTGTFDGYGIVDQLSSGTLQVTIYDVSTGAPQDQWTVGPN